jgi:protein-disulfide isomerase
MKTATSVLVLFLCCVASEVLAQSPRRRAGGRTTARKPVTNQPAPVQPTPVSTPVVSPAPVLLAVVNGQNITTGDLEPKVREEVEALPSRLAEARSQILEIEINTALLDSEARKRRLSSQQLYELEVARKITEPGAAEIDKFIADNRDQIEETDPAAMREQVVAFLRGEREAKLSAEFVKRLRRSHTVVMGPDPDTTNLAPSAVVATVAGRPILAGNVNERLKPIIYKLRLDTYLLQKPALDQTINDLLLLAEANRRNVGPEEIIRKEISEKVQPPAEAEIAKFYSENKTRLNGELDSFRSQIATYLQEQNRQRLEREMADRLRKAVDIRLLISEPEPPVQAISLDDDPVRGDAAAAVTIVEFTDFQCPACAAMQPVIDDVLKSYGSKVKLVVRDFPLAMHPNASKAAEAANAAHAQGKFFEYTDLLFKRQKALDVPSLKKYATELGLNRALFDAALDSGKFAAEVKHDIADGELYGIESTPTIFVNGIALRALSADALRAAIDRSLGSAQKARAQ